MVEDNEYLPKEMMKQFGEQAKDLAVRNYGELR